MHFDFSWLLRFTPGAYCCGLTRSTFECSLFKPDKYALAEATMMSGSDPTPLTIRPERDRRIVTSPCDSVPLLIAFTETSTSSAPLIASYSIALTVASTAPPPSPSQKYPCNPSQTQPGYRGLAPTLRQRLKAGMLPAR